MLNIISTILQIIAFGIAIFFVVSLILKLFFKHHISKYFMFVTSLSSVNLLHRLFSAIAEYIMKGKKEAFLEVVINPIKYYDNILFSNPWVGGTGLFLWWLLCLSFAGFLVETYILEFLRRKNDNFLRVLFSLGLSYVLLNFFGGGLENLNAVVFLFLSHVWLPCLIIVLFVGAVYYGVLERVGRFLGDLLYRLTSGEREEKLIFPDTIDVDSVEYESSFVSSRIPRGTVLFSDDDEVYVYDGKDTLFHVIENRKGKIIVKWKIKKEKN